MAPKKSGMVRDRYVRAWLAAAFTSLAAVIAAPSALAAYPGANGRIAYERHTSAGTWVESVKPDGSDRQRLAPGTDPSWSADGTKIVYSRPVTHRQDIFLMNADGGDQRRLTTRYGVEDSPSLSPDGQWVVYAESGFGGSHIEIQQIDGSDRRSLVRNGGYASDPEFSPDGKHIVYSQGGIYVVPLEGGRIHRLTRRNGLRPDYSPDGSHIVFYEHLGKRLKTFVMRADGSHLHSVPCSSRTPAYSPNGNRLAFSVGAKPTGTDIWTTRLSKPCNRRAVTHLPGAAFDPSWQPLLAG